MLIWRKFFRGKRSILRFIIKAQVPIEVSIFRQRERELFLFSKATVNKRMAPRTGAGIIGAGDRRIGERERGGEEIYESNPADRVDDGR